MMLVQLIISGGLGRLNVRLSRAADAVVEVVYSIPVFLKGDIGDVDN